MRYIDHRMNMAQKIISLIFVLPAIGLTAMGQDGNTSYSFLDITSSTTVYGLGGVNISTVIDELNIIDQNPALLGPEFGRQVSASYMRYLGDSNFAGARFGMPLSGRSAMSFGIHYFGYGEMTEADASGSILGTFSPKDVTFSGVFSHDITDRLRGGITMKGAYSAYSEFSAFALATDLGINYFDPECDLSLSAVVTNLGGQLKRFDEAYHRLPIDLRLGWTQSFEGLPIRFSITAWNLTKWHLPYYDTAYGRTDSMMEIKESFSSNLFRHLIFAADLVPSDKFHVGIGYNYKSRTDMRRYSRDLLSGFSLGGAIKVKTFGIGVALARPHTGATTLMFNVSTNINEL